MAEKAQNPSSLWGKPLPANLHKLQTKEPKMATEEYEEDFDEKTADVDAELGDDADDQLADDEASADAYAENATADSDDEENEEEDAYDSEAGDDAEVSYVNDDTEDNTEEPDHDDDVAAVSTTTDTKKQKKDDSDMKKRGSDHIREEIARRRESGASLRGVDIVKALAKKRVTVSAAQVSQLLKAEGVPRAPRGRQKTAEKPVGKPAPVAAAPVADTASRAAAQRPKKLDYPQTELPLDQLKAASAFLDACGGDYDAAASILNVHRQVGSVMTR